MWTSSNLKNRRQLTYLKHESRLGFAGAQAALGVELSSSPSWVDHPGPSARGDDQAKVAFVRGLDPGAQKMFHNFFQ